MNRKLTWLALGAAVVGMGISMPSCPGQQAMQQQIDELKTKNAEMTKQLQAHDNQVKTLMGEMSQVKTLLQQISSAVLAQKQALEQIDAAMKTKSGKSKTSRSSATRASKPRTGR